MMKRKRATVKRVTSRKTRQIQGAGALFMETSAQMLRLAGSPEIQRGINELVDGSSKVGTSWFVRHEFEQTYIKFYSFVAEAAGMLPNPDRSRPFEDLWEEVHYLMPMFFPGGSTLFPHLTTTMYKKFAGQLITPTILRNVFGGLKEDLERSFLQPILFNKSKCEVWRTRGSCHCHPEPGDECRLKEICIATNLDFLASATTLASARREESLWIKNNLMRLQAARGKSLLELVGSHPGHMGDLIIFWEVPDRWTVLTRDYTFKILQKAHREKIRVYMVRLPRLSSGGRCRVRFPTAEKDVEGVLINYNAKGARIRAPLTSVKKAQTVTVTAPEFGSARVGDVAYLDPNDQFVFAVKFKFKRPRG